MERAPREKLVSSVSTLCDRLKRIREERRKAQEEKDEDEWQQFLNEIGQEPLSFGSDQLDAAIAYCEDQVLESAVRGWESCRISFKPEKKYEYPFFPSNAKLGESGLADLFRERAVANLHKALKMRNPELEMELKLNSYTIRFHFE